MERFGAEMHKWGLRTSASCACGAATQNAEHLLFDCNLLRLANTVKNSDSQPRLLTILPAALINPLKINHFDQKLINDLKFKD